MEELSFIKNFTADRLADSLVAIVLAIVIYQIVSIPFRRLVDRHKKEHSSGATHAAMLAGLVRIAYIVTVVLVLLQINGFDVSTMLAGVGVASVIIGLAVQDTLKDIIRGFSILSEDYFKLGDYVKIGDVSGTVVRAGIRSTKLRDASTGNIISIANRNIEQAEVSATTINLDVPLPYDLKLEKAEEIMSEIVAAASQHETVAECEYRGVNELTDSSINYHIFAKSTKGKRIVAKRAILHCVLETLEKHHINIPYPQIDVHQKAR